MSKQYKSAAVINSDSDLPPVEELMTPSRGRKRAPRHLESPSNASSSLKPVTKKTRVQDDASPVKATACSLIKSPVKGATRGGTAAEDIVEGKHVHAIEAAKANNLSSDEDEDDQSDAKGHRNESCKPTVHVEYDPDATFKIGKGKTIKKPSAVAANPSDSDRERAGTPPSKGVNESDIEKTPRVFKAHAQATQDISRDEESETVLSDGGGHGSENRALRSKYDIEDESVPSSDNSP
ncbi:hypothetical protein ARMGADRAFT_1087755 [Armillaria gallica]|uniref:Uncharacterized protein n=1 Tax=Armillaria gallica TaxID=47427 RepID=A0A2H3CT94_ARMGA|nr:hypothetical protein ARMGADRAFT_1087755 [Armillaria gallica]